uniref:Uncharacterized protein n=1 Tax=Arundo donax TaxID=35708 RepID=A0A0A9DAP8_ARUDO
MALLIQYMTGPKSLISGCQIRMTPIRLTPRKTGGYLDARMDCASLKNLWRLNTLQEAVVGQ